METTSPKGWTPGTLDSLTALRFFAALYVVLYHRRVELSGAGELLDRIVAHGYIGVPLFFVLSGFVLAYNYVTADGRFSGSPARFYVVRLARIYPVYLLALVLFAPIALKSKAIPDGTLGLTIFSSLTLTQSWTEAIYWNRPGWTVSTEAFFYLAFPFLVAPMCRLARRNARATIVALWLVSMLAVVVHGAVAPIDELWLRVVKHNPIFRLPSFLIGVVLGLMFVDAPAARRRGSIYVGVSVVGLGVAAMLETPGIWATLWHNGFLAPLFGLLIYGLALRDREGGRVPAILRRLGEASYGLYILQTPIHATCMAAVAMVTGAGLSARSDVASSPWFVLGYVVVLGVCAIACLRWYEEPARAAIRRLAAREVDARAERVADSGIRVAA